MTTFRRIAVHEAGHAAVVIALGGKFRVAFGIPRVRVSDDEARLTFGSVDGLRELSADDVAVVALAGRAAEVVVHEDLESRLPALAVASGAQLSPRADRVIRDLANRHPTDYATYLRLTSRPTIDVRDVERALGIVEKNVSAIQRIADAMLDRTGEGLAFDSCQRLISDREGIVGG